MSETKRAMYHVYYKFNGGEGTMRVETEKVNVNNYPEWVEALKKTVSKETPSPAIVASFIEIGEL